MIEKLEFWDKIAVITSVLVIVLLVLRVVYKIYLNMKKWHEN